MNDVEAYAALDKVRRVLMGNFPHEVKDALRQAKAMLNEMDLGDGERREKSTRNRMVTSENLSNRSEA